MSAAAADGGQAGGTEPGELDPRVAEALQQLRSGVRQRQAEVATIGGIGDDGAVGGSGGGGGVTALAQGLLAVKSCEYVQEPVAFSHRPRWGSLIVFVRKAFFHLFLKWFMRPVLAQQNAFNQAAGRLLQELAEAEERARRETRLLAARVAQLEAARGAAAAVAAGGDATAPPVAAGGDPAPPVAAGGGPTTPPAAPAGQGRQG
jgi:hypothetical protein